MEVNKRKIESRGQHFLVSSVDTAEKKRLYRRTKIFTNFFPEHISATKSNDKKTLEKEKHLLEII